MPVLEPQDDAPSVDDRELRNLGVALFILIIIGSAGATAVHHIEPNTHLINITLPPFITLSHLFLLIYLLKNPAHTLQVYWISMMTLLGCNTIAVWYFTIQAALSPTVELVTTLPPVSAFPIICITIMFIFARPKQVMITAIIAWFLIALPILLYLIIHPQELFTPRGLEMTITLGPRLAGVAVLIPFHRGVEKTVQSLRSDRDRIQHLAELDPLTQIYNRRGFEKILKNILASHPKQLGIILFDIDHFKRINDQHGHSVGDVVLAEVARRCQISLRKDDCIARWGGEEFLVVIQGAEDKALCKIAETLREAIAHPSISPAGKVTASFGVTQFRIADSIETIIQRVDEAMYTAKHLGRNRVIFQ